MTTRTIDAPARWTASGVALLLAGCLAVTVNVSFPQEKIDNAASSIEDLVRAPKQAPADPAAPAPAPSAPPADKPRSDVAPAARDARRNGGAAAWRAWLGPSVAEAQVPELKTRTPEIMAVIQSRASRFGRLAGEMAKGCVGENSRGLVEARPGTGCAGDVAALVAAENSDRMTLYQTLVQQNKMPPGDIARVQAAFARENRERAPKGAWVQDDGGGWRRK
jgi:uncharacterized protein YdbL (DUF1318 family)